MILFIDIPGIEGEEGGERKRFNEKEMAEVEQEGAESKIGVSVNVVQNSAPKH